MMFEKNRCGLKSGALIAGMIGLTVGLYDHGSIAQASGHAAAKGAVLSDGQIAPETISVPVLDWPIEIVSDGHGFTEGPAVASDGTIYFSDMDNRNILNFHPQSGQTTVWQKESRCSNGLFIRNDTLYACEAVGRAVVMYDLRRGPGSRQVLADRYEGKRLGSPNDLARVDEMLIFSEFWLGNHLNSEGEIREIFDNRVYLLSLNDLTLDTVQFDFSTPNGVAYSSVTRKVYIGDIRTHHVYAANMDKGTIGETKLLTNLVPYGKRGPDGMAVDSLGRIFLALYGSGELLVLNHDGVPVGTLITGPKTSNCVFAEDGKTLYVTADHKLKRVVVPAASD